MNKKTAVSLLLIVLLTIFFSLALIGNLNVAKAGDQGTGSNVSATVGSIPGITVVNVSSLQSFIDEGFSATLTATIENTGSSTLAFRLRSAVMIYLSILRLLQSPAKAQPPFLLCGIQLVLP